MPSNEELLARRSRHREEANKPLVGDFVVFTNSYDGESRTRTERISHDWDEYGVQTSPGGSFYLGDGFTSFSGTLNPTIPTEKLKDTGEISQGSFWFFSKDYRAAGNSIHIEAPCRVYNYAGDINDQLYNDKGRP